MVSKQNTQSSGETASAERKRRTILWHVIKSCVVVGVLFVVIAYYGYVNPQTATASLHQRQMQARHHRSLLQQRLQPTDLGKNSTVSSSNPTTAKQPFYFWNSYQMPPVLDDDDDDDDDVNVTICFNVTQIPEEEQCNHVQTYCVDSFPGQYVGVFMDWRYCGMQSVPYVFFFIAILILVILFYMLGDTAENYFCPSLAEFSAALKLSPNVAGVTFLALGNGAPDISSIISGVIGGSSGFGIGEPIGAGLFCSTVVMAAVSIVSDAKVTRRPFLRDIITYLLAVIFVFICVVDGKLELWESIFCLVLYFIYVTIVIVGRYVYLYLKKRNQQAPQSINHKTATNDASASTEGTSLLSPVRSDQNVASDDEDGVGGWKRGFTPVYEIARLTDLESLRSDYTNTDEEQQIVGLEKREKSNLSLAAAYFPKIGLVLDPQFIRAQRIRSHGFSPSNTTGAAHYGASTASNQHSKEGSVMIQDHFADHSSVITRYSNNTDADDDKEEARFLDNSFVGKVKRSVYDMLDSVEWHEKAWYSRIFLILVYPTIIARNLTIPSADRSKWSRFWICLFPLVGPVFSLFAITNSFTETIHNTDFPIAALLTLIGIPFSVFLFITTRSSRVPRYYMVIVVLSFVQSILWIYIIANALIDLLQAVGIMLGISDVILAITVLAWGNSLGDMFADIVVAKQGFPSMAVGAIFGGACMNLLIGLGISVTAYTIKTGNDFILELTPIMLLTFVCLVVSLVTSLVVVPLSKFRSPRWVSVWLVFIYIVFMVLGVLIEADIIPNVPLN